MKVKDLIANLLKQNQENEVWVATQDGTNALDIAEVTNGTIGKDETFTIIITEESVDNGDYHEPLK